MLSFHGNNVNKQALRGRPVLSTGGLPLTMQRRMRQAVRRTLIAGLLVAFAPLLIPAIAAQEGDDWRRWGGPGGDFIITEAPRLAASWPEAGPPRLWGWSLV